MLLVEIEIQRVRPLLTTLFCKNFFVRLYLMADLARRVFNFLWSFLNYLLLICPLYCRRQIVITFRFLILYFNLKVSPLVGCCLFCLFVCLRGRLHRNEGKWESHFSGIQSHVLRLTLITCLHSSGQNKHSYLLGQFNPNTTTAVRIMPGQQNQQWFFVFAFLFLFPHYDGSVSSTHLRAHQTKAHLE